MPDSSFWTTDTSEEDELKKKQAEQQLQQLEAEQTAERSSFWTKPPEQATSNFWTQPESPDPTKNFWNEGLPPDLNEAQKKAIWPSFNEVIRQSLVGVALTGARIGEGMASLVPEIPAFAEYYRGLQDKLIKEEPQTIGGEIVRNTARFVGAEAPIQMMLGPLGMGTAIGRMILGPTAADLVAFPHNERRLSNTLSEIGDGSVATKVFDYLAADPEDGAAEGTFKQALEGVLANAAIAPAAHLIGMAYRGAKSLKNQTAATAVGHVPAAALDVQKYDSDILANQMLNDWHSTVNVNGKNVANKSNLADSYVPGLDRKQLGITDEMAFSAEYAKRLMSMPFYKNTPPEDIQLIAESFKKRLLANEKPKPRTAPEEILNAIDTDQEKMLQANDTTVKQWATKTKEWFVKNWLDSAGNVKSKLLSEAGLPGQRAVELFNLAKGATIKGRDHAERAVGEIYADLSTPDANELAKIIRLRRDADIKLRDPSYSLPADFGSVRGKDVKAEDIATALSLKRAKMGDEHFDMLNGRADLYFSKMRDAVDVLEATGVVSMDEAVKLKKFDYSPVKFLEDVIDPAESVTLPGKGTISVRSSGIHALKGGTEKALLENDPKFLLSQVMIRAHARAARNEAAQAMLDVAEQGQSSIVSRTKPPKGDWSPISARVGGQTKTFYMDSNYVEDWMTNPHVLDKADRWISRASGTSLMKSLTTGADPFAILGLFPRDLMFAWLSADKGRMYSINPFKFMAEIGPDMAAVSKDAWNRTGKFREFLDEGGGMYLMTHQGQVYKPDRLVQPNNIAAKAWQKFEHLAGYLGETQEIAVRLAVREKAIRDMAPVFNGKPMVTPEIQQRATAIARDYMDYSQGGYLTKRVDAFIPYYNATVLGMKGVAEAAGNDPLKMSGKMAWLASGFVGSWLFAHEMIGGEQQNISAYDRANNFVFPLPTYSIDAQGNKKYDYVKLPMDQSMAPLKATIDGALDAMVYGKPQNSELWQIASSLASVVPNPQNIPIVAALSRLNNFDPFRAENVFKGDPNLPAEMKYNDNTSDIFRDIGGATGIAPAQLQAAINSFGGSNSFAQMFSNLYDATSTKADEYNVVNQTMIDAIKGIPGMSRLVGKTHPLNSLSDDMDAMAEPAAMEKKIALDTFDRVVNGDIRKGQISTSMTVDQVSAAQNWIKEYARTSPEYASMMFDRLRMTVVTDRIFKDEQASPLVRQPAFWFKLIQQPPDVRADLFLDELARLQNYRSETISEEEKKKAQLALRQTKKIASALGGFDPKTSMAFGFRLQKAALQRGVRIE